MFRAQQLKKKNSATCPPVTQGFCREGERESEKRGKERENTTKRKKYTNEYSPNIWHKKCEFCWGDFCYKAPAKICFLNKSLGHRRSPRQFNLKCDRMKASIHTVENFNPDLESSPQRGALLCVSLETFNLD